MKLQEADAKLAELFPGKYRAVKYEMTTRTDGEVVYCCTVYVDGGNHHNAPTFQGAINSLMGIVEEPQNIDDGGEDEDYKR